VNKPSHPDRLTDRLHAGRISASGARYFVTFVTADRKPWLKTAASAQAALETLRFWHEENDGRILAVTVMPDHLHVLFELGTRLTLGRCLARWKASTRHKIDYAEDWQRDFWEHRVREDERWEDYGLYIFLNPYRAGLISRGEAWPWWWVPEPKVFSFMQALDSRGAPPSEWIDWPEDRFAGLKVGE
jgi:REP element-mobilizing transposase RayT